VISAGVLPSNTPKQTMCHVLANIISFPTTIVAFLHAQCKENFQNNPCSLQCDFEWHFH
jgi:hypothetical protein